MVVVVVAEGPKPCVAGAAASLGSRRLAQFPCGRRLCCGDRSPLGLEALSPHAPSVGARPRCLAREAWDRAPGTVIQRDHASGSRAGASAVRHSPGVRRSRRPSPCAGTVHSWSE